jgi:hypothetical protein
MLRLFLLNPTSVNQINILQLSNFSNLMTLAVQKPLTGNTNILSLNSTIEHGQFNLDLPSFIQASQQLSYNNRIRIILHVSDEIKQHFILVKGLIEFSRGQNFSFTYDKEAGSLQTDFNVQNAALLENFLKGIEAWLRKEIAFKKALKEVISFEEQYKRKSALVYSTIL